MEKRTKLLLEQQQKSVLQTNKKQADVSFESIKDFSDKKDMLEKENTMMDDVIPKEKLVDNNIEEEKTEETLLFKNKIDIEKELFEEFNSENDTEYKKDNDNVNLMKDKVEDVVEDKKLPDVSIDEYMKNFDENEFKENEISSLFNEDDIFPNIPI